MNCWNPPAQPVYQVTGLQAQLAGMSITQYHIRLTADKVFATDIDLPLSFSLWMA